MATKTDMVTADQVSTLDLPVNLNVPAILESSTFFAKIGLEKHAADTAIAGIDAQVEALTKRKLDLLQISDGCGELLIRVGAEK